MVRYTYRVVLNTVLVAYVLDWIRLHHDNDKLCKQVHMKLLVATTFNEGNYLT